MKLTIQKLYQLIKEQFDDETIRKLAQKRRGYLMDLPRQQYTDTPLKDEYGREVYRKDEYGEETHDLEYELGPMKDEYRRSRIADMRASGMEPEFVDKISKKLMSDDPFDSQAELIATDLDTEFSTIQDPQISSAIVSKLKLRKAYDEIRNSDELRDYTLSLSRRMYHDGSMDYEDNFYEADEALTEFEQEVAKKHNLTKEEIEELHNLLKLDKEAY